MSVSSFDTFVHFCGATLSGRIKEQLRQFAQVGQSHLGQLAQIMHKVEEAELVGGGVFAQNYITEALEWLEELTNELDTNAAHLEVAWRRATEPPCMLNQQLHCTETLQIHYFRARI